MVYFVICMVFVFCFKQKTAYEMRISDWSSDVCSSDLRRAERANLLGYPNHAAYSLEDQTAHTTEAVNKMLGDLAPAAVANARREAADMQKLIDAEKGGFKLASWDWEIGRAHV